MKKIFYWAILTGFTACTSSNQSSESGEEAAVATETPAVCVWDDISVRKTPDKQGKWLTALKKGEKLTTTGETALDSAEKVTYKKVILTDGTTGWASANLIVDNAKPAVFTGDADIYSRPDLMTKTQKQFSTLDIVAVRDDTTGGEGWLQVVGKRNQGKWIEEAWVRQAGLSYDETDMVMAKNILGTMKMEDDEAKTKALNDLLVTDDMNNSVFRDYVQKLLDEIQIPDPQPEEQEEADSVSGS